jgi:hypothetical protein
MTEAELHPDRLLRALAAARARFYVIGGAMVQVYLPDYVTRDLDLLVEGEDNNLRVIWDALAPFHPQIVGEREPLTLQGLSHALFRRELVELRTDAGPLDLFVEAPGLGHYRQAKRAVRKVRLYGLAVEGLKAEALLETKVAVGRPKDRPIIARLRALLGRTP